MFRTWLFHVKHLLVAGENTLVIRFDSPLPYIAEHQAIRNVPGWNGPKELAGRAWLRKEPCNFGWDWGPVLTTCGIWRPIELVAMDTARLADVCIHQDHATPGQVGLTIDVAADTVAQPALTARIAVALDGTVVAETTVAVQDGAGTGVLVITDPQLWWPNNLGAQPLYHVTVTLLHDDVVLDTAVKRIGLRTLRPVSYTHLRAHETRHDLVCRLLLEKKKTEKIIYQSKDNKHRERKMGNEEQKKQK
eukprot:TRINITY_DN6087_c0_g1_i1.p2 TRINITY_DN6087_c0_g1~~TRINITY_DN6087_c0_g1_i1.p2  ORF type:complete len:248 (-),score=44.24 TRINITY_DN6087_c0_g1_i1:8-751(-)